MASDKDRDRMADACLLAAEQVNEHGSPELQAAMRMLLFILGQEIAGQRVGPANSNDELREP